MINNTTQLKKEKTLQKKIEYVDVVNDADDIVGTVSWDEMFAKKLIHRTAAVLLFNSHGEIYVHKRCDHLKQYPGKYDIKFGGAVQSAESYEAAARRELFEEAHVLATALIPLFKLQTRSAENNANRMMFKLVYDGKIILDETEATDGKFMKIIDVEKLISSGKLSPSGIDVFRKFKEMKFN